MPSIRSFNILCSEAGTHVLYTPDLNICLLLVCLLMATKFLSFLDDCPVFGQVFLLEHCQACVVQHASSWACRASGKAEM